ncbi:hypothetical protein WJX73_004802 [Symbiochloris irregularis]|uniref:3-hydroxyisobutyryl-CoA hydrolase n=1 Tax=Symbiochloris irregularis TaxID=706552 RepID=A0AAW1PN73_9CHLO
MAQAEAEVLYDRHGSWGVATLNRGKALNALNLFMVKSLREQYLAWAKDPAIKAILIRANIEKAFCAGGDVKTAVQLPTEEAISFFRHEYMLNGVLGSLPKPHVALMDGIIMGGGAGISVHGRFRVATERTLFAMPECAIGLFPDVGASYFLPRLPGELGAFLALTGTRLKGADVVASGLATHLVPSAKMPELRDKLFSLGDRVGNAAAIEATISALQEPAQPSQAGPLSRTQAEAISSTFCFNTVEQIYAALERRGDAWSKETLKLMKGGSPLSQKLSLREVREGAHQTLAQCLVSQFRLVTHVLRRDSDFKRGVRALLIDKSGPAQWQPPSLEEVTPELVDAYFEALPAGEELQLDDVSEKSSGSPTSRL